MNERIKQIREANDMSQKDFAAALGLSRGVIANIEQNLTAPKEYVISLICQEFNVNEAWLRTGEGEMNVSTTPKDEISRFIAEIMKDEPNNEFKRKFIRAASKLTPEGWDALEDFIESITE